MKQIVISWFLFLWMGLMKNIVSGSLTSIYLNTTKVCRSKQFNTIASRNQVYEIKPATGNDSRFLDCSLKFNSSRKKNICATVIDNTTFPELPLCPYLIYIYSKYRFWTKTFDCGGWFSTKPKTLFYCSSKDILYIKLERKASKHIRIYDDPYDFTVYVAEDDHPSYGTTTIMPTSTSSQSSWDEDYATKRTKPEEEEVTVGSVIGTTVGFLISLSCGVALCCCCCKRTRGYSGNTYQQQQPLVIYPSATQPTTEYPMSGVHPQSTGNHPQAAGYHPPHQSVPYPQQLYSQNTAADLPPSYEEAIKESTPPQPSAPPMYEKIMVDSPR